MAKVMVSIYNPETGEEIKVLQVSTYDPSEEVTAEAITEVLEGMYRFDVEVKAQ